MEISENILSIYLLFVEFKHFQLETAVARGIQFPVAIAQCLRLNW